MLRPEDGLVHKARFDQVSSFTIIEGLLRQMDETGLQLPADVDVAKTTDPEG